MHHLFGRSGAGPGCDTLRYRNIESFFFKSAVKVLSSWYEQLKVQFTI
jgi:hypothetical protein